MTRARRRVLIFSPFLEGHRAVYMSVLADVALNADWEVVFAAAFTSAGDAVVCPHLDRYHEERHASFIDVAGEPAGGLDIDSGSFVRLVQRAGADVTVLAHADNHIRLLNSQLCGAARRLPGRRVGIFISSTNFVHGWGRDRPLREWVRHYRHYPKTWRGQPALFHRVLLPTFRLVDVALCLDELFVGSRGEPYRWMPDIDATLGARRGREESAEARMWRERLQPFLARNSGRSVFVYYGMAQARRGYDVLLRLAVQEGGCLIHAGRRVDDDAYEYDVHSLRRVLAERSALFETGEYLEQFDTAGVFLGAAHHVVLPYRTHYGSSGVMLQALRAGRPVLVPDSGLMAHRVRLHRLGAVYRAGDWEDMRRQNAILSRVNADEFRNPIERFLKYFSEDQIVSAIGGALGLAGAGALRPLPR
jgi:glycosyltransferase involved in cell wall biosynthesis